MPELKKIKTKFSGLMMWLAYTQICTSEEKLERIFKCQKCIKACLGTSVV
jgi:hypothetical protein